MVLEISSEAEFGEQVRGPGLVVVDFFTTWCGPCKMIAPFVEELARKYPEVKFLKVDTDKNPWASGLGIQSIPTFFFYVRGGKVDEMKGANAAALESKVLQHRVEVTQSFGGKGATLGSSAPAWDGVGVPPGDNARAARLRAFGALDQKAPAPSTSKPDNQGEAPMEVDVDEDAAVALAMELTQSEALSQDALDDAEAAAAVAEEFCAAETEGDQSWGEEMVAVPVDEALLGELVEMGFSDVRGRKGLVHGKTIDGALAWIDAHQDDADIDQPYMVRRADIRAPLTKEELLLKQAEVKQKIIRMRAEKARDEKARELQGEKERRERGQKLGETQEERDRLMRKREAEKAKREKDAAVKERERLRAEIARDKEVRKLNKGVLPSVLGVDGYNPSIVNYNGKAAAAGAQEEGASRPEPAATKAVSKAAPQPQRAVAKSSATSSASADPRSPEEVVDASLETLCRYRTGGDGGRALALLATFVRNVVENPEEPKFKSINPESAAFKAKLAPLVGPGQLLKAVGFLKDADGKLKLESFDYDLLADTLQKLVKAEDTYKKMNP